MATAEQRKTLSIKNKPGMWQEPSKIELIEERLKETAKTALDEYIRNYPPAPSYNESYRLNSAITQQMYNFISTAYEELLSTLKFSTQAKVIFEKMTNHVNEYLKKEVGGYAGKFNDALESFNHPKQTLPKVSLSVR